MKNKVVHSDPTYLRTIHDGLLSGVVHKDNASALPMGLVGMYEEALPPAVSVKERKKFLEFFAVWALLKKEVSADFVLPLLEGWTEDQVIDYIAQYSKWFNSPMSGKYVLYHERLRTFILQKVSAHQFEKCNEQIIHQCQLVLQAKTSEEWERYALEYLSTHLLIQAMESKDSVALKALSYNTIHWNRQIEISKGFEWSKRMLNDMMLWASKYNDDEVIECALNKVDLHHLEQNDAPRIVELVAQNDIETALQRIESFGGNDKEGLQRKFILYMLCLMELTLLDSKDKPFRKEAIEKLLKHLDDNLPVDHSVLNWNDFFPSYLMFQIACEWAELGLDYFIIYQKTDQWIKFSLEEKAPYTDMQFRVLLDCARYTIDKQFGDETLKMLSVELAKIGRVADAYELVKECREVSNLMAGMISIAEEEKRLKIRDRLNQNVDKTAQDKGDFFNDVEFDNLIMDLSIDRVVQFWERGKKREGIEEVLNSSDEVNRDSFVQKVSIELANKGMFDESIDFILYFETQYGIETEIILCDWIIAAVCNNRLSEAVAILLSSALKQKIRGVITAANLLEKASRIQDLEYLVQALLNFYDQMDDEDKNAGDEMDLYLLMSKVGKLDASVNRAFQLKDDPAKFALLREIYAQMAYQGLLEKALLHSDEMVSREDVLSFLNFLAEGLVRRGRNEEADIVINRIITLITKEESVEPRNKAYTYIFSNPIYQRRYKEVLDIYFTQLGENQILDVMREKGEHAFLEISLAYAKKGALVESINLAFRIKDASIQRDAIREIFLEFTTQDKLQQGIDYALEKFQFDLDSRVLSEICVHLSDLGRVNHALNCIPRLDEVNQSRAIVSMFNLLAKKNDLANLNLVRLELKQFLKVPTNNPENHYRDLIELAKAFAYDKKNSDVRFCFDLIKSGFDRVYAISSVIGEIAIVNKEVELDFLLSIAIKELDEIKEPKRSLAKKIICDAMLAMGIHKTAEDFASTIELDSDRRNALINIYSEYAVNEKLMEAIQFCRSLTGNGELLKALKVVSIKLVKKHKFNDVLTCIDCISDSSEKSMLLSEIVLELVRQDEFHMACNLSESILSGRVKYEAWDGMADIYIEKYGHERAAMMFFKLLNGDMKFAFLERLFRDFFFPNSSEHFIDWLKLSQNSTCDVMEKILVHYALYKMFFENVQVGEMKRFEKLINLNSLA